MEVLVGGMPATCVCIYIYVCVSIYMYVYVCVHMCMCLYVCMYECVYGDIVSQFSNELVANRVEHGGACRRDATPYVCMYACMNVFMCKYRNMVRRLSGKFVAYIYVYIHADMPS